MTVSVLNDVLEYESKFNLSTGTNVSYAWAYGDGDTGSGAVITHTYASTGNYTAVVTASNSTNTVTTTTSVTINATGDTPISGLTATNNSPTDLGQVTTLTATISAGTNVNCTWAFGDGNSGSGAVITHTYANTGNYSAVVTATNSVNSVSTTTPVTVTDVSITGLLASNDSPTQVGQATTLTATLATGTNVNYAWAFGDGTTGSGAVITHSYPSAGTYAAIVTATNSVGTLSTSTPVTITAVGDTPISGLTATNDSPTEVGQATTLTATVIAGTNVSYAWAFGDGNIGSGAVVNHTYPSTGNYTAVVTASNSVSTITTTIPVTITDVWVSGLNVNTDSPTVVGSATTFTATTNAGTNVSYTWAFGDGFLGSGQVVTHTYTHAGSLYTAIVTASNSMNSITGTAYVQVDFPIISLWVYNDSPTELGQVTTLNSLAMAGTNVNYAWAFGDGTIGSGKLVTHTYTSAGNYSAVVTATNSVSVVTNTTQVVIESPVSGLTATNDSPTVSGETTTLTATISAGTNVNYAWAFGDGDTGSGAVVTHTYTSSGNYTAVVTASNSTNTLTTNTHVEITAPAPVTVTRTISYTYDPLNRLTDASYSTGEEFAYQYDAVGNRTAMTDTTGSTSYIYDAANRLTSVDGVTYTWDARGNLTYDGVYTYTYNAAGRMVVAENITTTLQYTYTADGLRVVQDVDGVDTTFAWDWATSVPEMLSDGDSLYLIGYDTLAWEDASGWSYPVPDALGSVRQVVDATGDLVDAREWTPYGVEVGGSQTGLGYTGEWFDGSVEMTYLRARWYDAFTGRLTQQDDWFGDAFSPRSLHRYVYVLNTPLQLVDPSGFWGCSNMPLFPPGECPIVSHIETPEFASLAHIEPGEIDEKGGLAEYYRSECAQYVLARTMYSEVYRNKSNTEAEMRYVGWIVKIRVASNHNFWNEASGSGGEGPTPWHNQLLRNEYQFEGLWKQTSAQNPDNLVLFHMALRYAKNIIDSSILMVPDELRGYDGFLAYLTYPPGEIDREGGKESRIFHTGQNVYRDVGIQDEGLWDFTPHPGQYE